MAQIRQKWEIECTLTSECPLLRRFAQVELARLYYNNVTVQTWSELFNTEYHQRCKKLANKLHNHAVRLLHKISDKYEIYGMARATSTLKRRSDIILAYEESDGWQDKMKVVIVWTED